MALRSDSKKGFTLIEIVAAMAIMSVALVPMMRLVPGMIQSKVAVEQKTTALFLAEQKTEEIKQLLLNDFSTSVAAVETSFNAPHQDYRFTIAETSEIAGFLKNITVTTWHSNRSRGRVILNTQVADR